MSKSLFVLIKCYKTNMDVDSCLLFSHVQSPEVQQQLTFLLSKSPSLEQLWLEDSGLKW